MLIFENGKNIVVGDLTACLNLTDVGQCVSKVVKWRLAQTTVAQLLFCLESRQKELHFYRHLVSYGRK